MALYKDGRLKDGVDIGAGRVGRRIIVTEANDFIIKKKGKQQFDLNGCSSTNFFLLPTDINSLIDFHR